MDRIPYITSIIERERLLAKGLKHDSAQKTRGAKVAVGEIWFRFWGDNALPGLETYSSRNFFRRVQGYDSEELLAGAREYHRLTVK